MLDPHAILAQVSHNEAREEWLVRHAKDEARKIAIIVGIFAAILWIPFFTFVTLVFAWLVFGASSSSNPFPLLFHVPWLVLPALFLFSGFVYIVWRSEKNKGDAVLVLLPEGIVECERWKNARKRRIKSFEYANLEGVTLKVERGNISFLLPHMTPLPVEDCVPHIQSGDLVFDIAYQDGRHEKWSLADKYFVQPGDILVQRIITDYALHTQRSKAFQVYHEQAGSKPPK